MMTHRHVMRGAIAAGTFALAFGSLPAVHAATDYRPGTAEGLANPGPITNSAGQWIVHSTGSWGGHNVGISTTTNARGAYTVAPRRLLTKKSIPGWMGARSKAKGKTVRNSSVWAPSVLRAANGTYVAYYSVTVKGTKAARCIGTGTSNKPEGPFKASSRALACWKGSGTKQYDTIKSEGKGFSLIDPTPALIGNQLVLTYKTQFKSGSKWHTTTRLLKLDPANPTKNAKNPIKKNGDSIKITDERHKYIEENPVLVQRGKTLTLFTSFGWYGTCKYTTRYRQNSKLWKGWLKKKPAPLRFAVKPNTCGSGNAHITKTSSGNWLIFFNGHHDTDTKGGPKNLYVAPLTWSKGKPKIGKL